MNRRALLAAAAYSEQDARAAKAIAFDAFGVFDPRPISISGG
jgi:hypothetical protein